MEENNLKDKILSYYKSGMPFCDRVDVPPEVLEQYAGHAVFLRQQVDWCRALPEHIFMEYVAGYRINNERIEECRKWFFDMIYEKICDYDLEDAVLEVNLWCAANGTYHLADERTANAVTVYKSGLGRCGEESVFTVTVLRSVGIAARQVYAPLWSHCDDNHAWVEVWCGNRWRYLGACEPEQVLDKGWFDIPASRAMLIHARGFGKTAGEEVVSRDGCVTYINATAHYASVARVELVLKGQDDRPIANTSLQLSVLNYAAYGSIASIMTDGEGKAVITLGLGDVEISCIYENEYLQGRLRVMRPGVVEVVLLKPENGAWMEYEMKAPRAGTAKPSACVTEEEQRAFKDKLEAAKRSRLERLDAYYDRQRAKSYPEAEGFLKAAAGNFDQVIGFLEKDGNPSRLSMLKALTEKDLYDLRAEILEEHLSHAAAFQGIYPDEIFINYLQNPRIEYEELSCYRKEIERYFKQEEKEAFIRWPAAAWTWICEHIEEPIEDAYDTLRVTPAGALLSGRANQKSRKVLFAAILRTLGIPARLNPVTGEPECYIDDCFQSVTSLRKDSQAAELTVRFQEHTDWRCRSSWSLSLLDGDKWKVLDLEKEPVQADRMNLGLSPGFYRLIAVHRTEEGGQLVREQLFALHAGQRVETGLNKHSLSGIRQQKKVTLPPLDLLLYGKAVSPGRDRSPCMIVWLEEEKEPSEHIINELADRIADVDAVKHRIFLIPREPMKKGGTLEKLALAGGLPLYEAADWDRSLVVAGLMEQEAGQYPLAVVMDEEGFGTYGASGYQVGVAEQLLNRIADRSMYDGN